MLKQIINEISNHLQQVEQYVTTIRDKPLKALQDGNIAYTIQIHIEAIKLLLTIKN